MEDSEGGWKMDLSGSNLSIGSELAKDCFLPLQNRSYLCTQSALLFRHVTFDHSSSSDCFLCSWLYVSARGLLAYACMYVSSRACVYVRMSCIF